MTAAAIADSRHHHSPIAIQTLSTFQKQITKQCSRVADIAVSKITVSRGNLLIAVVRRQPSVGARTGVLVEKAIQIFTAVNFLVIGLSHIFQRSVWVEYFAKLHSRGQLGAFAEGFLYLNFGALIVSFHNVWSGPAVVLTLVGWTQILKAMLRFVAPLIVLRIYKKMGEERAWQIQAAGGFLLALSAFFGFLAIQKTVP